VKIESTRDVLRGVLEDRRHVVRQRAEHPVQMIGAVLKIGSIDSDRNGPWRVRRQYRDEFGVRCPD
jgi:hypothetical protein